MEEIIASYQIYNTLIENPLINELGFKSPSFLIRDLIYKYDEKHRYYHNINHIIEQFNQIGLLFEKGRIDENLKNQLEIVSIFHDIIYDPRCSENEVLSADIFEGCCSKNEFNYVLVELIKNTILETDYFGYNFMTSNRLSGIFNSIDFYLDFADSQTLIDNEKKIIKEFQFLSFPIYREQKLKLLQTVIDRRMNTKNVRILKEWLINYVPSIGLYPGTFKPFHNGHLNILEQAERIFDKVIIMQGINQKKNNSEIDDYSNCFEVLPFHQIIMNNGLTVHILRELSNYSEATIIRGLRSGNDLEYELNLRRFMEDSYYDTNVVFFASGIAYQHISSSILRELSDMDIEEYDKYIPSKYEYVHHLHLLQGNEQEK